MSATTTSSSCCPVWPMISRTESLAVRPERDLRGEIIAA